mgnify:CR=1 FL=1
MITKNEFLALDQSNYLAHHGVKGMRWGKHLAAKNIKKGDRYLARAEEIRKRPIDISNASTVSRTKTSDGEPDYKVVKNKDSATYDSNGTYNGKLREKLRTYKRYAKKSIRSEVREKKLATKMSTINRKEKELKWSRLYKKHGKAVFNKERYAHLAKTFFSAAEAMQTTRDFNYHGMFSGVNNNRNWNRIARANDRMNQRRDRKLAKLK